MARPLKEINQEQFEALCGMQCTEEEICSWFGVTDKTLAKWCKRTYGKSFSDVFRQKRGKGKIALRRAQYQKALLGNATMLVWLGKQYLNQRDQVEIEAKAEITDDALSRSLKELAEELESDE